MQTLYTLIKFIDGTPDNPIIWDPTIQSGDSLFWICTLVLILFFSGTALFASKKLAIYQDIKQGVHLRTSYVTNVKKR